MPSGMNDALCPLSRNVVSANAASPSGAGSAGMNAGRSTSVTAITPSSIDILLVAVATNAKRGPTYCAAVDEIAAGIWRWTAPHPEWQPDAEWGREVASFAFAVDETLVLVDPL